MEPNRADIRAMMIAVNQIDGLYYFVSRALGLKYHTFALLYALSDGQWHSQKQICEDWLIPRSTINTVVQECRKNGYVTLGTGKEKALLLTEDGIRYAGQILTPVLRAEEEALANTQRTCSGDVASIFCAFASHLQQTFEPILQERPEASEERRKKTMLTLQKVSAQTENLAQIRALYEAAFPENERRPFETLFSDAFPAQETLALYDGQQFCGFASVLNAVEISHIIFLAIEEPLRNRGYGAQALQALHAHCSPRRVMVDIERTLPGAVNLEQRQRRKRFYLRNGYAETEIQYDWQGEAYEILSFGGAVSEQEYGAFWKQLGFSR